MLTSDDIQWIRQNRGEITQGRTEVIQAKRTVQGEKDPITGEPTKTSDDVTLEVVWREVKPLRDGDFQTVEGIQLRLGDVMVTFNDPSDLEGIDILRKGGLRYRLIAVNKRGIGSPNRLECVARVVT